MKAADLLHFHFIIHTIFVKYTLRVFLSLMPWLVYNIFMQKGIIMIGLFVGSSIGSYLPVLWGGSLLSFTSVLLGAIGGLAGVWAGYKITQSF